MMNKFNKKSQCVECGQGDMNQDNIGVMVVPLLLLLLS